MANKKSYTIDEILNQKIEVEKFKRLVRDMYRGFPNFEYKGMVEKVITTEKMREELKKSGFLIEESFVGKDGKSYPMYMLGASALPLVSAWETEDLTRKIKTLTIIALAIAGITLLLNLKIIGWF